MSFCRLTKGITLRICRLCLCHNLKNNRSFESFMCLGLTVWYFRREILLHRSVHNVSRASNRVHRRCVAASPIVSVSRRHWLRTCSSALWPHKGRACSRCQLSRPDAEVRLPAVWRFPQRVTGLGYFRQILTVSGPFSLLLRFGPLSDLWTSSF